MGEKPRFSLVELLNRLNICWRDIWSCLSTCVYGETLQGNMLRDVKSPQSATAPTHVSSKIRCRKRKIHHGFSGGFGQSREKISCKKDQISAEHTFLLKHRAHFVLRHNKTPHSVLSQKVLISCSCQ